MWPAPTEQPFVIHEARIQAKKRAMGFKPHRSFEMFSERLDQLGETPPFPVPLELLSFPPLAPTPFVLLCGLKMFIGPW